VSVEASIPSTALRRFESYRFRQLLNSGHTAGTSTAAILAA
jgi:hypothetical protein